MLSWFSGVKEEICVVLQGSHAGRSSKEIQEAVSRARAERGHWFPNALKLPAIESVLLKLETLRWVTKRIRQTSFLETMLHEPEYVLSLAGQRRARPVGVELDDLGRPLAGDYR